MAILEGSNPPPPGAPFSLLFLNKLNDNSGLDHLSGPLLGPLGQIFEKASGADGPVT